MFHAKIWYFLQKYGTRNLRLPGVCTLTKLQLHDADDGCLKPNVSVTSFDVGDKSRHDDRLKCRQYHCHRLFLLPVRTVTRCKETETVLNKNLFLTDV